MQSLTGHADRACRFTYPAWPVRAVDGDTVRLVLDLGLNVSTRQDVRIQYVNAPERSAADPATRAAAVRATHFVEDWFNRAISIAGVGDRSRFDREWPLTVVTWLDRLSFNRVVGVVENLDGESLGDALVAAGHAVLSPPIGKR